MIFSESIGSVGLQIRNFQFVKTNSKKRVIFFFEISWNSWRNQVWIPWEGLLRCLKVNRFVLWGKILKMQWKVWRLERIWNCHGNKWKQMESSMERCHPKPTIKVHVLCFCFVLRDFLADVNTRIAGQQSQLSTLQVLLGILAKTWSPVIEIALYSNQHKIFDIFSTLQVEQSKKNLMSCLCWIFLCSLRLKIKLFTSKMWIIMTENKKSCSQAKCELSWQKTMLLFGSKRHTMSQIWEVTCIQLCEWKEHTE